jgi:hypothetical protein
MASFVDPLGSVKSPLPVGDEIAPSGSQATSRSSSPPPPPTPAKAVFSPVGSTASYPDSPLHSASVNASPRTTEVWRSEQSPLHGDPWASSPPVPRTQPQSPASARQPASPSPFSPGPPRSPFTDLPPPALRASKVYDEEAGRQITIQRERERQTLQKQQQAQTNGTKTKGDPFVKVHVRGLERVRKELWVKIEASVSTPCFSEGSLS